MFDQPLAIRVVELIAMAMPFLNLGAAVGFMRARAFLDLARVRAEPHGPALVLDRALIVHEIDDRGRAARVEFRAGGVRQAGHIAREFNDGALHAETQPQVWDALLASMADRRDLSFDAAVPKAAGDNH